MRRRFEIANRIVADVVERQRRESPHLVRQAPIGHPIHADVGDGETRGR